VRLRRWSRVGDASGAIVRSASLNRGRALKRGAA
jgi:hypothetical protein